MDNLMWYVCYGSNLCFDRFKCYLTGEACEKYNIKKNSERRCIDPTLPDKDKSKLIMVPYELYFDYESNTWDGSSVAFLDLHMKGQTIGRGYLLTEEQYEHVKRWECGNGKRGPRATDLYGYEIDLGIIDGYPAKTFTRYERLGDPHPVSLLYRDCMIEGLVECGLRKRQAREYYYSKLYNNPSIIEYDHNGIKRIHRDRGDGFNIPWGKKTYSQKKHTIFTFLNVDTTAFWKVCGKEKQRFYEQYDVTENNIDALRDEIVNLYRKCIVDADVFRKKEKIQFMEKHLL